jgi:signal transduction histidine kinase
MGVGLSISKSIVDAQYRGIWAGSEPRAGTMLSFTLPLETAEIKE